MSHRTQLQSLNDRSASYHSHTMTPTSSHSPIQKMAPPQRTSSTDSAADGIRKRVCKACDRCRLKKSKCDGSHPCSRCKADNAICVFGERKKSHDKVYPKGYVEMLEQQQQQLVSGLQEMYKRLVAANAWSGPALSETNGHPLTHDILAALDLLESKQDGSGEMETFEEDCAKLQSKLLAEGAGFTQRRGSFSSDSEHSQHGHARSVSHGTPTLSKPTMFKDNFNFSAPPSPPAEQSPMPVPPRHRSSFPPAQPSPLQQSSPLASDPQFYQAEWAYQNLGNMDDITNSFGQWDSPSQYDMAGFTSYPQQQMSNTLGGMPRLNDGSMTMDPASIEHMDVDFNRDFHSFIQVMS